MSPSSVPADKLSRGHAVLVNKAFVLERWMLWMRDRRSSSASCRLSSGDTAARATNNRVFLAAIKLLQLACDDRC